LRGVGELVDHCECGFVRQAALRADSSMAHGCERALDRVGRADASSAPRGSPATRALVMPPPAAGLQSARCPSRAADDYSVERRPSDSRRSGVFTSLVGHSLADLQAASLATASLQELAVANHQAISAVAEEDEECERARHIAAEPSYDVPTSVLLG
jgi:hypothetical protein